MNRRTRSLILSIVCLTLAGLIVASEAYCQDRSESAVKLTALYGGAWALELAGTEYALQQNPNAYEANPLMGKRSARIGVGVASTALFVVATKKLQQDGHPGTARWMKRVVVAVRVVLAVHDFRQAR